jgi:CRISPR-associated protein Cmr5
LSHLSCSKAGGSMITLEQKLAQVVYGKVAAYGQTHPVDSVNRKQYGAMAHRLPILVHNAGLVQALAFVEDRGNDAHKELLDHLAAVLEFSNRSELLSESRTAEFQSYRYLTRRVNIALSWFKRFAQSVLDVEPTAERE